MLTNAPVLIAIETTAYSGLEGAGLRSTLLRLNGLLSDFSANAVEGIGEDARNRKSVA